MAKFVEKFLAVFLTLLFVRSLQAQASVDPTRFNAFEVATVKRVNAIEDRHGRVFRMEGPHRWVATNFTLKLLIGLAYDLNPKTIEGANGWMNTDHFDIEALTPGEAAPDRAGQMRMLRTLLAERFKLQFHRAPREYSIYELNVAKGGVKLKPAVVSADQPSTVIGQASPSGIRIPATNATMEDLAAMLQRAILDRPVLDKTGLKGRYDFTLEWAHNESEVAGDAGTASADTQLPPLFVAIKEQLGLTLTATHGTVQALIVDSAVAPTAD